MSTVTAPTATEIAEVLGRARAHIVRVGFCKKYWWNTRQERDGTPLELCAVDLDGAITTAVHGTPHHLGQDPLTRAAVAAVLGQVDAPSLGAWCEYRGNGRAQAIALLRRTEERLRVIARAAS